MGNIKYILKSNNYISLYIPIGMSMALQPLDRSINFPFKCYLKDMFTSFLLDNKDKIKEKIDEFQKKNCKRYF